MYLFTGLDLQAGCKQNALNEEFSFKCLSVMIYEQFIVSIVELIMLSCKPTLLYNFNNI